ncbi:stage IV sporulation protein A [Falcatimonas sp. MSJ-15]|uniref:stage IV sporulation protein A n=1 Tax=Falcatimonas sp. MSJ-15 TaxID=2841515 RepID=UPI001C0FE2ED|nr:stage IV sporulation protein A [Falcatimonas sp. MSJ-15]MBU5470787.1 stage IV sporulation protein A [Falcatimonas sp. MSJ-15]
MDYNTEYDLYKDIEKRTNGELYIGVVGPVRTGKSTFVRRFMEILLAEGKISSAGEIKDQLPLSGKGSDITTVEPKFIPKNAIKLNIADDLEIKVRLIDSVGYIVESAKGYMSENGPRMVKTPWFEQEIPFAKAAEEGTKRVIHDHSAIGIVVTTDGSITDIAREDYEKTEERVIRELKDIGKPYVIILNTRKPASKDTLELAKTLQEKYNNTVIPIDCEQLKKSDIIWILKGIIDEFYVTELKFYVPEWVLMLDNSHYIKEGLIDISRSLMQKVIKIRDIRQIQNDTEYNFITGVKVNSVNSERGTADIDIKIDSRCYYETLSQITGVEMKNEIELIELIRELSLNRQRYNRISEAVEKVNSEGYAVILPEKENVEIFEPEVIKNGNRYGIKLRAKAPSIHMIQTDIETEIAPIVGDINQANDLIEYIKNSKNSYDSGIWETNIFGKTVEQIVDDGFNAKVLNMTAESQEKIRETLEKVTNDNNGLVCIIV